jgi:hypothetical protein
MFLLERFFVFDAAGFFDESNKLLLLHVMDRLLMGYLSGDFP